MSNSAVGFRRGLVDPVLTSFLEDFEAAVKALQKSPGGQYRAIAERLCILSRDIRFRLGPPRDAPADLVTLITALFRDAAQAISSHVGPGADLEAFCANIRERAEILQGELPTNVHT